MMRLHTVITSLAVVVAAGCGQTSAKPEAASAKGEVSQDVSIGDAPTRALSPVLPGDDPTFRAAIDAYDPEVLEQRTMALTGLRSDDLGGGYFGQKLFMSFWAPVVPGAAMSVCHDLVAYANELDFPATEIVVQQKTYDDFQAAQDLVAVDATGTCAEVDA